MTADIFDLAGSIREVVREELRAAFALLNYDVRGELSDGYWDGSIPASEIPERIHLSFQRSHDAKQSVDGIPDPVAGLASAGAHPRGLDTVDDRLSEGQIVSNLGGPELDEFHASPSLIADTESVGDGPRPDAQEPPDAGHPQGGDA